VLQLVPLTMAPLWNSWAGSLALLLADWLIRVSVHALQLSQSFRYPLAQPLH
jgi:hypothetical protein